MSIFQHYQSRYEKSQEEEFSLQDFLSLCKNDKLAYASASERLLTAIGKPEMVDTATDPSFSKIFSNRVIKRYPAFINFKSIKEVIE